MRPYKLQFISAFLGNLFEHYDLALYTLLTPFFASIFFSDKNPLSALIMSFGIIPLSMLARPIGAMVFGYIGDNYGRQRALFISLLGLGVVSGLLAFIPTYQQVGMWAPLLLLIGRILQNFFGIGENLGGAIYLLENSSEKKQNFISSLYSSSTVAGFLLASFGVSVLCHYQSVENSWRYLYLIGSLTAVFGAILRNKMPIDPTEVKSEKSSNWMKDVSAVYWEYRKIILLIAVVAGFSYSTATIALIFFNGFIPLISMVSKEQMLTLNTWLLLVDLLALPLCGLLSEKFSRQRMMVFSAFSTLIVGIPLFSLLEMASLPTIVIVRLTIVLLGVWFTAPFHAWAQKLVPSHHRYTVISFGYALGSQLIGGPTAFFSLWIYQQTNQVWTAACYWVFLALVTGLTLTRIVRFNGLFVAQNETGRQ